MNQLIQMLKSPDIESNRLALVIIEFIASKDGEWAELKIKLQNFLLSHSHYVDTDQERLSIYEKLADIVFPD